MRSTECTQFILVASGKFCWMTFLPTTSPQPPLMTAYLFSDSQWLGSRGLCPRPAPPAIISTGPVLPVNTSSNAIAPSTKLARLQSYIQMPPWCVYWRHKIHITRLQQPETMVLVLLHCSPTVCSGSLLQLSLKAAFTMPHAHQQQGKISLSSRTSPHCLTAHLAKVSSTIF